MKIRGVDFVMYRVSDLARAVEFYRDALGLQLEMHSPEYQWAEFDCGNVTLSLHGSQLDTAAGAGDPGPASSKAAPAPATHGARITLAVDDIDAAFAEMGARGVRVSQPLQDFGVCRAFEILDPDGNPLLLHRRRDGTFGREIPLPHAGPRS